MVEGGEDNIGAIQKMGRERRLREQTFDITIEEEHILTKEENLMKEKLKDGGYNFE